MSDFWGKYKGFDELIFERRNKEYGAFRLRKDYSRSVLPGLLISIFLCGSFTVIPFLSSKNKILVSIKKVDFESSHLQSNFSQLLIENIPEPPTKPGLPKEKHDNFNSNQSRPDLVLAADKEDFMWHVVPGMKSHVALSR